MRLLFIYLFLGSLLFSDEIDRVNSMVKDISELRNSSIKHSEKGASKESFICNDELKSCKNELKNEHENVKVLKKRLQISANNNFSELNNKIVVMQKKIEKQEKLIQIKDNKIKALIGRKKVKAKTTIKLEKKVYFRPKPFRLKNEAPIYDAINGKKLYMWEKHRTFTSGTKTEHWIKITGYFIHKKWTETKIPMWIKKEDTIER